MSIATTKTKLSLAAWAQILGVHPLHFAGIDYTPDGRSSSSCASPLPQYAWQEADRVGREDIARAIAEAESQMERQLGWDLVPTWQVDDWRMAPRPNRPELWFGLPMDARGRANAITPSRGRVLTGGVEAKEVIDLTASIVWSDEDNDGADDTATVTFNAGTYASCEVEVYYPGHNAAAEFQIRPVTVSVVGGVGTAVFKRQLVVAEGLLFGFSQQPVVWTDDSHFLSTVEVWRHYNDPSRQAILMWSPFLGCGSCSGGCPTCAYAVQDGCVHLRLPGNGSMLGVTPAVWDAATHSFLPRSYAMSLSPDMVRLFYQAGNVAPDGCPSIMEGQWARAVAYYSCSFLERPLCECTLNTIDHWREDFAIASGGEQTMIFGGGVQQKAADNPLGTTRGALYAWNKICGPDVAWAGSTTLV